MNLLVVAFSTFAAQSWRIGCLILMLVILRWAIRGRVPQQVFFVSWIIVALALLVPVSIPVAWSPVIVASQPLSSAQEGPNVSPRSTGTGIPGLYSLLNSATAPSISSKSGQVRFWSASSFIMSVGLFGVATLFAISAARWYRFRRRLSQVVAPVKSQYLAAVAECAEMLKIKTRILVFLTDAAVGPAMGGLFRPYLIIPSSLGESLSKEELRLVILHELGHWHRRDTVANLLVQWALFLHWFNPAAWIFANMARLDCELACDEFVLGHMAAARPCEYGTTILKVLATVRRRNAPSALLGILGRKQQIKRRIDMIARFRTDSAPRIVVGCCLIAGVAIVAATSKSKAANADFPQSGKDTAKNQIVATEMKHYENTEWKFALDVPSRWNRFPPVSSNSPYEVVRFELHEDGMNNLLIIFRQPLDPKQSLSEWAGKVQEILAKGGFGNFVTGKTTIGPSAVVTLDFDKTGPNGDTWSCRHYFVADGTLGYVLGFGTNKRAEMIDLYDRMAKSFQMLE